MPKVAKGATRSELRVAANELYEGLGAGVNPQTGTSYTLVLDDSGKDIKHTNAGATNITVPNLEWVAGTVVNIWNLGAGLITLVQGSGITLNKPGSKTFVLKEQGSAVSIKFWGGGVCNVVGDLTDA